MANLHLVTGYAGTPHISAGDAGALNASIIGSGQYVMDYGSKLSATVVTNNLVRVHDGVIIMQGRQIRIEENTTVDLAIDSGVSGYYRNDLIVARYTKDASTGVEEANLVVIKGTQSTSSATDPAYTVGDILNGAVKADFPLYRISIDGLNAKEPVALFNVVGNFGEHIGNKNNPHNVTAAQVGAAASNHTHSITSMSGTLSIAKGGTGATSASAARNALGLGNTTGALPIANGGTGATSAAAARTALGVTPANIGAAKSDHTHAYSAITGKPTFTWDASTGTLAIKV